MVIVVLQATTQATGNKKAYRPGHWFNSAKFFDIEYQTYGLVAAQTENFEKDRKSVV